MKLELFSKPTQRLSILVTLVAFIGLNIGVCVVANRNWNVATDILLYVLFIVLLRLIILLVRAKGDVSLRVILIIVIIIYLSFVVIKTWCFFMYT